jgi:hypothetical protein
MGVAFGANLLLAAVILLARGTDFHGTEPALRASARIAFVWFWVAYTGGPLTTLFGGTFLPLKQHGRELGLAFAAALSVHLLLVAWLCLIGAAPALGVFMFFGPLRPLRFFLHSSPLETARGAWPEGMAAVADNRNEFYP